jgi:hypothetical protein
VALVRGKVRNPLDHVMTVTDGGGRFAFYPPKDTKYYFVILHPDAGFRLLRGDFEARDKITLMAWAGLDVKLDQDPDGQQTASLSTRVPAYDGWPEIVFNQYWSDLHEQAPDSVFHYAHIPPIHEAGISRDVPEEHGSSSFAGASVSLLPGEVRQIALGPITEQQRTMHERMRELSRRPRGQAPASSDGTTPSATLTPAN